MSLHVKTNQEVRMTTREVQQWFRSSGITIRQWAERNGFNPALVYTVVQGKRKCLRGQSHQIAVALGIKDSA